MSLPDKPVRDFTKGKLTHDRLTEISRSLENLSRVVNTLLAEKQQAISGRPIAVVVGEQQSVGKYFATAYLGPYNMKVKIPPDEQKDLTVEDLGERTVECWLWNLTEMSGGSALTEGQVVDASIVGMTSESFPILKTSVDPFFPWVKVRVSDSSGSAGTSGSAATFTYSIHAFSIAGTTDSDNLIADSVTLEPPRSIGLRTAAPDGSPGMAYQNSDGTWKLIWVGGEIEGGIVCEE